MKLAKYSLKNKHTLITGAAGLLGRQHSKALLEIESNLILTDINSKKLEELKKDLVEEFPKSKILIYKMNISSEEEILSVSKKLSKLKKTVDVLVNNAAIDPKIGNIHNKAKSRLESFNSSQWDKELDVGLKGAFLCTKVFGTKMAKNGGGVILNISSDLSVISPDQSLYEVKGAPKHLQPVKPVTYSVIKTGLIGLTRYTATYWSREGVRCNSISPGGVLDNQDIKFVKKLEEKIPLGRMATIDEYNSTIQYLCSDASSYLNGQNIVIDGGRSVL